MAHLDAFFDFRLVWVTVWVQSSSMIVLLRKRKQRVRILIKNLVVCENWQVLNTPSGRIFERNTEPSHDRFWVKADFTGSIGIGAFLATKFGSQCIFQHKLLALVAFMLCLRLRKQLQLVAHLLSPIIYGKVKIWVITEQTLRRSPLSWFTRRDFFFEALRKDIIPFSVLHIPIWRSVWTFLLGRGTKRKFLIKLVFVIHGKSMFEACLI